MEHNATQRTSMTTRTTSTALGMYVGVFLMITCGSLLGADFAHAAELAPTSRAEITAIVNASHPQERCGGQVRIVWVHDLQAMDPAVAATGMRILGYAYGVDDGSCDIGVLSNLDPELACTAALHEREHLAGVGHATGDPLMGNAIGDFGSYRDPRCASVVTLAWDDAMDDMWGRVHATTAVRCRRTTVAEFTCITTARKGDRTQKTWVVKALAGGRVSARVVAAIA